MARWCKLVKSIDDVYSAAEAGFDAVELTTSQLMDLDDKRFTAVKQSLKNTALSFQVFSEPVPGSTQITEPGFNIYVWSEYLKRSIDRMAELGGQYIIWSNGRSRVLPLEGPDDAAKRQALQFAFMLAGLAGERDMSLLIEPLDPRRTNYINNMKEIEIFFEQAKSENLSAAISLRDLKAIGLDYQSIDKYKQLISHVYMEFPGIPEARIAPSSGDGFDYKPFLQSLQKTGYNGLITLPVNADASSLKYCQAVL